MSVETTVEAVMELLEKRGRRVCRERYAVKYYGGDDTEHVGGCNIGRHRLDYRRPVLRVIWICGRNIIADEKCPPGETKGMLFVVEDYDGGYMAYLRREEGCNLVQEDGFKVLVCSGVDSVYVIDRDALSELIKIICGHHAKLPPPPKPEETFSGISEDCIYYTVEPGPEGCAFIPAVLPECVVHGDDEEYR